MITLSDRALEVELHPDVGGSIGRLQFQGHDVLRSADTGSIKNKQPLGMSCFPLVPFSNRVGGNGFQYGEREISLEPNMAADEYPIHGHGWQSTWNVVSNSSTKAELIYASDASEWPWAYETVQAFELLDDSIHMSMTVRNLSLETMPLGIGWHPYFPLHKGTRLTFACQGVWECGEDLLPTRAIDVPEEWDFARGKLVENTSVDNCFFGWDGHASIYNPLTDLEILIRASELFDHAVFYVPRADDFFCFEPASHRNNAFNQHEGAGSPGFLELQPGQSTEGAMTISVRRSAEASR
jgi:aldose 1-epimerase